MDRHRHPFDRHAAVPHEVPGDTSSTDRLRLDAPVDGVVDTAGDQDWYRFVAARGHTYVFDLVGIGLADPYLRLLDAHGEELAVNDDAQGRDSRILFSPARHADLFLSAQGFEDFTGAYRLSARELVGDVPGSVATRACLKLNAPVDGTVDLATDQDWYRLRVEAGHSYVVDLEGAGAGSGTLGDPTLRLLDARGRDIMLAQGGGEGDDAKLGFVADASGHVYLSAEGNGSDAGTFRLRVHEVVGDIPGDATTDARLTAGAATSGTIDYPTDQDWFRLAVEPGRTYVVDLSGRDGGGGTLADPRLRLLDAAGGELVANDDGGVGSDAQLGFTASAGGEVLLAVSGWKSGSYELRVREDAGDVPGAISTGATLTVDAPLDSDIGFARDQDWYRFAVTEGHSYAFDLKGTGAGYGSLPDAMLRLLDAAGNELLVDDDGGAAYDAELGFTAREDGVVLLSAEGTGDARGSYRLSARDVPGDLPDSAATLAGVAVGEPVPGTVDFAGDRDWYRFQPEAGHSYVFSLQGAQSGAGTLGDPFLSLLDAEGNLLASGDDVFPTLAFPGPVTLDSIFAYTPDSSAPLFLAAQASTVGGRGSYLLGVREVVGDVPGDTGSSAVLALDAPAAGVVDYPGDQDWFRFAAEAGRTYVVTLAGAAGELGPLGVPSLNLRDGDGNVLARGWVGFADDPAVLGFKAPVTGEFLLAVEGLDASMGAYRLSARELVGDVPADTGTQASLAVGAPVTGVTEFAGDQDWVRFTGEAGRTYVVDLLGAATGDGSLADPTLRLLDAEGNERWSNQDSGEGANAQLGFVATGAGPVYLSAEGMDAGTGSWRLAVRELVGDVAGGPSTGLDLAVGGEVVGTIDYGGDADWYRMAVRAGHTYVLDILADSLTAPLLNLLDEDGNYLATASDDFGFVQRGFTATADGVIFASAEGASSEDVGSYRLTAREIAGDVPADAGTTAVLALDRPLTGTIDYAGDPDWYRFQVAAGHTYVLDLAGADSGAGTLTNPGLALRAADGTELAAGRDGGPGSDAQLGFTTAADGTVFVSAEGEGGAVGSFRLSARELTGDVPEGDASQAVLTLGEPVLGTIDFASDTDRFHFRVEAGQTYLLELRGSATGAGTLTDPSLSLTDSRGDTLSGVDAGIGPDDRILYRAVEDGEVVLDVRSGQGEEDQGGYRLSATVDGGELLGDLPQLQEGVPLASAALQPASDNGPQGTGELYLTWLGGSTGLDDTLCFSRIAGDGAGLLAPVVAFPSCAALAAGDSVLLGRFGSEDDLALFVIADGATVAPDLHRLDPGDLILRDPATGAPATAYDDAPPELVRLDGSAPAVVAADLAFAIGDGFESPLNPGGFAQATVGSFSRAGVELCSVVAIEDGLIAGGRSDGDFNDAVVAVSVGRLGADDVAALRDWLFP